MSLKKIITIIIGVIAIRYGLMAPLIWYLTCYAFSYGTPTFTEALLKGSAVVLIVDLLMSRVTLKASITRIR